MAGKGVGSTAGQVGGAAIGGYLGGAGGAQIGATAGSALGGALDPRSQDPRQTPRQMGTFNPYQQFGPMGQIESAVLGGMAPTAGSYGSTYVGPRGEQTRMLKELESEQKLARPLYGESVQQQRDVVGGKYLNPMQQAPFQQLSDARQSIARQMFEDAQSNMRSAASARGNFGSGARVAQLNREAGRIGTQAAQDIAQAGWTQYGAERGYQEQAARGGMQLAPNLAAKVFESGETLRSAEQMGNRDALMANLQARGYDNQAIGNALDYMRLRGLTPTQPIIGQSPNEAMAGYIQSAAPLVQGLGSTIGDWWKGGPASQPYAGLGDQVAATK